MFLISRSFVFCFILFIVYDFDIFEIMGCYIWYIYMYIVCSSCVFFVGGGFNILRFVILV